MKRIVINLLAAIGALFLFYHALGIAVNAISPPSYEEQATEAFGTPGGIRDVTALYERIEASPHSPELELVKERHPLMPELTPQFPIMRKIPRIWISGTFKFWGLSEYSEVRALYDDKDQLIGVDFHGTRYGAFISRDATKCPNRFYLLKTLSEKPLCIRWYLPDQNSG